jgi:energy-converting hydrogenase Eha subunit H
MRPFRKSAIAALALLAAGVAGVLLPHTRQGTLIYMLATLPLFAGAFLSIRLLHSAWTELSILPLPARVRWRIRSQMTFITPVAGPLYWLWLRPVT